MQVPIQFPSQAEVIREEVRRFRALSPEEKVRALGEMYRVYRFLLESSPRPEVLTRLAQEEEEAQRAAIEAFAARHA